MKKSKFRIALGVAVRERRKQLGLSQDAFADLVGLHRTYIGGIERGERNLTLDNLERISTSLAVPMSVLVERAESAGREKDFGDGLVSRTKP
ncbi:TPA: helix-turn-helix transcriptional regulator [Pseudomonas aeruginosa]|nr:helix-turn-helix transcriptional regulator [Pseudomonas aeruginosa]HEJ3838080.1 helix-turn-helix transcriptional regulator [Pseudomonas aeruginosa]HEK1287241.1 helix-turn-helix transcriptional regulator [Pseudomonas aeruginosa]